jgi:glycosyltransferase involved in cell wall biosynthesis
MSLRVLALSSYGVLGGAELALDTFLAHRPAGVDPRVLLLTDGAIRGRLEAQGLPVAATQGMEGPPDLRSAGRFTRVLAADLGRDRPDVVWAIGQKGAMLAVPACRALRVPLVWHKVDFSWDRQLAQPLAAAVDGVVAVSTAVTEALGPWRRRRLLEVVGVPISLPEDLRVVPAGDPPAIGTLARLHPYKGASHILRAAALLSPEFPDLRVVLAGGPVPEYPDHPAELRTLADALDLDGRVEMPGFVDDVVSVLRRLTVFVNATHEHEGFGKEALSGSMLEAGWAGLPVVGPRLGGNAEGLIEGISGTLVEQPEPESLAAAIRPYLKDPALAAGAGEAGRRFARDRFRPAAAAARLFAALARAAA